MNDKIVKALIDHYFEKGINTLSREQGMILGLICSGKLIDGICLIGSSSGLSSLYIKPLLPHAYMDVFDYDYSGQKNSPGPVALRNTDLMMKKSGQSNYKLHNGNFKTMEKVLRNYDLVFMDLLHDKDYYLDYFNLLKNKLMPQACIVINDLDEIDQKTIAFFKQYTHFEIFNLLIFQI